MRLRSRGAVGRPVRSPARRSRRVLWGLPLLLATALGGTPGRAQAFAFDAQGSTGVLQHQTTGRPVTWAAPSIPFSLNVRRPDVPLAQVPPSWDTPVAAALALWNTVVPALFTVDITAQSPCDTGDAVNTIGFAPDHCGEGFGDVIAFTRKTYEARAGGWVVTRADVVLNAQHCWDAYPGPLRPTLCAGTLSYVIDLQRVVLHELGHVLGLEHPDEAGQTVPALMNRSLSDLDTLTLDDRLGAAFLYPQPLTTPTAAPASAPDPRAGGGGGGGCTLGPGQGIDPTLSAVLLGLVVVVRWRRPRWRGARPVGHASMPPQAADGPQRWRRPSRP